MALLPGVCNEVLGMWVSDDDTRKSRYRTDPHYSVGVDRPPLGADANGMVRPFSSFNTVAAAAAAFVGYTDASWNARGTGVTSGKKVTVYHAGAVEVYLSAAVSAPKGTLLAPFIDTDGKVSNHKFAVTGGANAVLTVCQDPPMCGPFADDGCAVDAAKVDVSTGTAFAAVVYPLGTKVVARWCNPSCGCATD